MKNYLKLHLLAFVACSALLAGCSGDSEAVEEPKSDDTSLTGFSFKKSYNDGLSSNMSSRSSGELIYITVPEEADLTALVPSFKVEDGASVTINGKPAESDITPCDFSSTTTLVVTSESGKSQNYTVLAKNGNPTIDNKVYNFMIKHSLPGVSVAISAGEETVYKAGYGFAVKDTKQRVTPQTLFRLASMSKQQTALGIMTLYEQGLLSIDDTVFGEGGLLEEEFGTDVLPTVKQITVKHLLQHTSGWSKDPIYTGATTSLEERIEDMIKNNVPDYTPGTTFDYNNLNFCILGKVIEAVSGKDYETFLHEEVHAKAGVSNIFVGKNSPSERRTQECRYYGQGGKDPYANDMVLSKAAGGMIANTEELMKLMAHIDYGTKVPDILKKETLDTMYKPISEGARYALGWRTNHATFDDWAAYHGGTLAGVCTIWARGENGVNGVILCNSRSYEKSIDTEMWFMLEEFQKMF